MWALLVAGAATIPLAEIAAPETLVNTFTPSSLVDLAHWARAALVAAAVVAGGLFVAVPRRLAWTLAVLVGVGLALASADSWRRVADASEHEDRVSMGSAPGG